MPSTLSPNMSLILPTVGQEPGPNWALDLNNSLSLIDQHDHASGSGVQITPAGINITTDLSFNSHNAISLRSVRMSSQVAPLALGTDLNCVYVSNGNLFFNDGSGNQVQITASGAVSGTPGSIGNLIPPAAVNYVPANQNFVFQSNQTTNTSGSIDCGPLFIRNITAGSNYIKIQPNAVLPANYTLTLPSSLPASTSVLLLNSLGNITTSGTAASLSVTTLNATTVFSDNIWNSTGRIRAIVPADSAGFRLYGRASDNLGTLDYWDNAQTSRLALISGGPNGFDLNVESPIGTYDFKVNNVITASITSSGFDGQYLYNASMTKVSSNSTIEYLINYTRPDPFAGPLTLTYVAPTLAIPADSGIMCVLSPASASPTAIASAVYVTVTGPGGYNQTKFFGTYDNKITSNTLLFTTATYPAGTYTISLKFDSANPGGSWPLSVLNYVFLATQV